MIIPVVLCLLYTAFFRVNAHGFATPKPVINYTSPLGTRPITCERFIQKSDSDLAICDGRIYRSSVYYCYSSKSRIRLKKCQRICGGGSEPEIKLCEERCPIYSTCNWGRKDENQTNCETYYDYLDKFTTTPTPLTTTTETETTTDAELKSTPSSKNSSEGGCICPRFPHSTSQIVVDAYIAWIVISIMFLMLALIIYLVFRDSRANRPEVPAEGQRRHSSESHSRYNPVSQDDDADAHETRIDLSQGTVTYRRDGISTLTGETASASSANPAPPSRDRDNVSSVQGNLDIAAITDSVDTEVPAMTESERLLPQDEPSHEEPQRRSISAPVSRTPSSPNPSPTRQRKNRKTSETMQPYY